MIIHVNIKKRCNITIYVTVYKYKLNILVHLMIKIAFYQSTIFRMSKKVKMLLLFGEDEVRRSYRGTYCLNYLILITNLALFHLQYVLLHHKIYTLVTIIGARGGYKIIITELIILLKVLIHLRWRDMWHWWQLSLFLSWFGCTFDFT